MWKRGCWLLLQQERTVTGSSNLFSLAFTLSSEVTTWSPIARSNLFFFFCSSPLTCTPHEVIFQPEFYPLMNRIGSTHGSCAGLMDPKAFGCTVLSPNLCSHWLPFLGYYPTINSHWCVPPGSRPSERRLASRDMELASLPSPTKNIVGGTPRHWEFFQLLYAQYSSNCTI